jgi:hypothetical protein
VKADVEIGILDKESSKKNKRGSIEVFNPFFMIFRMICVVSGGQDSFIAKCNRCTIEFDHLKGKST